MSIWGGTYAYIHILCCKTGLSFSAIRAAIAAEFWTPNIGFRFYMYWGNVPYVVLTELHASITSTRAFAFMNDSRKSGTDVDLQLCHPDATLCISIGFPRNIEQGDAFAVSENCICACGAMLD